MKQVLFVKSIKGVCWWINQSNKAQSQAPTVSESLPSQYLCTLCQEKKKNPVAFAYNNLYYSILIKDV